MTAGHLVTLLIIVGVLDVASKILLQVHAVWAFERAKASGYDTSDLVKLIRVTTDAKPRVALLRRERATKID